MKTTLLCAIAAIAIAITSPSAAQGPPPRLELKLAPHPAATPDEGYIAVEMRMEAPRLAKGEGLVRLPLTLVGVPSARYDGEALQARDDAGLLPLTQDEEPPTPQGVYRRWSVGRATRGDVIVTYRATPRHVTAATNNGPLFDLRAEGQAFLGAGNGFIATPVAPGPWRIRLEWDHSAEPAGAHGVWSMGEGTVETVGPSQLLGFSYYASGPLKRYPEADPHFGLFWMSDPPFDPQVLGEGVRKLYEAMSDFFGEEAGQYRVFMRSNPYVGTGGTGLARSFMFGYHAPSQPTVDDLQGLLSHEIAHTWPSMEGEHGDTAWYSEGNAEFYSLALSWRSGAIGLDRVVETMNERADAYYSNPYRGLTNPEAAKIFWTDPVAQTVPYGRGWMYLLQTDAAVRAATDGAESLDDVVKEMRRRQVAGESYGIADWLRLVGARLGEDEAKAMYDHMVSGGLLIPPEELYAPCLKVVKRPVRVFELGFARASLNDERIVRELDPASEAAKAGLREGDRIAEAKDLNTARKTQDGTVTLVVEREGGRQTITFLPRGAAVEAYGWARDPATPESACRF